MPGCFCTGPDKTGKCRCQQLEELRKERQLIDNYLETHGATVIPTGVSAFNDEIEYNPVTRNLRFRDQAAAKKRLVTSNERFLARKNNKKK